MTSNATTASFFDGYARGFDAIYGNENTLLNRVVNHTLRRSMRLRFDMTLQGCDPIEGKTVLDIGSGPGHYAVELARRGGSVHGVDFAQGMIDVASEHARLAGVSDRARFEIADFLTHPFDATYDYSIAMGFMDYMERPRTVVDRVLSLTRSRAFFSFPASGGLLAWQRQLRYRRKCDLYLYSRREIETLFDGTAATRVQIERIDRDWFVTAHIR